VYISDFDPWQRVNGTWRGALGQLLNDMKWIERIVNRGIYFFSSSYQNF
jgi:hypothetical protein